ncbi:hypothetical protein NXG27_00955 [Megasphaera paucivorans]|uniref:Uncharacterized protein n=1 Tax=Megasphaera paucivorans TaxID=349095 RepID=A0A1G9QCS0_9FIRM|nr:hypothetical protein [Megasphaera paucivorans]SDM08779.1 hypothetical protein SAMN05660299_00192 [Megasphaera paucivorans]
MRTREEDEKIIDGLVKDVAALKESMDSNESGKSTATANEGTQQNTEPSK